MFYSYFYLYYPEFNSLYISGAWDNLYHYFWQNTTTDFITVLQYKNGVLTMIGLNSKNQWRAAYG